MAIQEEGFVKTLVRGLVRGGGIYARARMAADQESDARKKEMRDFAVEKAKLAMQGDIAAANGYIEILKKKIAEAEKRSAADLKGEGGESTQVVEPPNREPQQTTEQPTLEGQKPVGETDVKNDELQLPSESNPKSEKDIPQKIADAIVGIANAVIDVPIKAFSKAWGLDISEDPLQAVRVPLISPADVDQLAEDLANTAIPVDEARKKVEAILKGLKFKTGDKSQEHIDTIVNAVISRMEEKRAKQKKE